MKQKYILVLCFSIALFLVIKNNNIKAQSNTQHNITASKPIIVQVPGGYRVEVENNPLINKNQSALEVLRAIPGVVIKESIIEVAGKNNLLLQVNGLDKKMTASQIVGYLSTISGNNIKQIEVIRNLSAAFNSSVGSVINVITKTSLSEGYFVNGRASVGNFNKCDAAVDLSIVKPKYNFSMSMAESYNKTFSNSEYRYETVYGIAFAGPYYPKTIETFDNPDVFMNNASVNVKYEYKINENQIIGGSIDYWGNSYSSILTNKTDVRRITPIPPLIQNKKESPGRSYIDLYSISTFKNKSQLDLKLNVALNNMNNRYVNQIFYPADSVLAYETIDNAKKYWTKDQDYTH